MAPFVHAPLSGPRSPPFAVRRAGGAARSPLAALAADDVRAWPSPSPNTHVLQAPSEAACSAAAGATTGSVRAHLLQARVRACPSPGRRRRQAWPRRFRRRGLMLVVRRRPSSARRGLASGAAPQRQWRLRRSRSNELATSAPSVQRRSSGTRRRQARTTTADGVRQR